jgi:uncharacterized repeat protein (TIGR03803 family)
LTPSGAFTILAWFDGSNGNWPGGLVAGQDGNLYGTTNPSGDVDNGRIFKLTPDGTLTTLVAFHGSDGRGPGHLVSGTDGNYYGATAEGGANGFGTIFRMAPDGRLKPCIHSPCLWQARGLQAKDGNVRHHLIWPNQRSIFCFR